MEIYLLKDDIYVGLVSDVGQPDPPNHPTPHPTHINSYASSRNSAVLAQQYCQDAGVVADLALWSCNTASTAMSHLHSRQWWITRAVATRPRPIVEETSTRIKCIRPPPKNH